jgi:hypothetical protein
MTLPPDYATYFHDDGSFECLKILSITKFNRFRSIVVFYIVGDVNILGPTANHSFAQGTSKGIRSMSKANDISILGTRMTSGIKQRIMMRR